MSPSGTITYARADQQADPANYPATGAELQAVFGRTGVDSVAFTSSFAVPTAPSGWIQGSAAYDGAESVRFTMDLDLTDDVIDYEETITAGFTFTPTVNTGTLLIAARKNPAGSPVGRADGLLDEVRISDTVVPTNELLAVSQTAVCGDGILDAGETCDDGNTTPGDCCSDTCQIEAAGTVCRASAGACDVAESCDGIADDCPADAFAPATTGCRSAAGVCHLAEACTGTDPSCPADALVLERSSAPRPSDARVPSAGREFLLGEDRWGAQVESAAASRAARRPEARAPLQEGSIR